MSIPAGSLAIETCGLTRRFGERTVVDDVSLHVPERSVYGFLGRNGAGKTTTIRLILGLLRPTAGSARVAGHDVATQRLDAARAVGALLDTHGFYPQLTGRENLNLTRRLLGLRTPEVDRVMEITEMAAHGSKRVGDYSLGMRQRLGLARAMLGSPSVLILDEPTNGLDPEGITEMRAFLRELPQRANATVLLSSHLLGEIEQTASHVGILSNGKLVLEGVLADLKARMAAEVEVGTDAPEGALALARANGFEGECRDQTLVLKVPAGHDLNRWCASLNSMLCVAGFNVYALVPRQQSLESLYLKVAQPSAVLS